MKTTKTKLMCAVMCLALTCGLASATEIVGTDQDNTLMAAGNESNSFGTTEHVVLGNSNDAGTEPGNRIPILRFDLSSYNGGPLVTAAGGTLSMTVKATNGGSVGRTIDLYPFVSAEAGWIEGTGNNSAALAGESAWNWHDKSNAWAGGAGAGSPGGGSIGSTALSSFTVTADALGAVWTWNISKAVLDSWITNDANNAGFLITQASHANGTIVQLASKEYSGDASYLPTLTFDLVPEPATMAVLGMGGLLALVRRRRRA